MFSRKTWWPILSIAGAILFGGAVLLLAEPVTPKVDGGDLKPQWQVGDQWVVETQSQQIQARTELPEKPDKETQLPPVQWQFTVQKEETLGEAKCLRLEIKCLVEGKQPVTTLWVDKKSMTVRQYQTQLPVQGRYRKLTESYQLQDGQPTPVLCPGSALPLDMPLFQKGATKGDETYVYEAVSGALGTKDPNDVTFTTEIKQKVNVVKPDAVKGLIAEDFSKDLDTKPVVEVELKTPDKSVRQLWRQEMPWPVFADNGITQARLVKFTPVKK